jgi:uncharacterized protein YecE (DUF72 family)
MAARLLVGTSGYVYGHWRRIFYPRDVPPAAWLAFYARHFGTVELNRPFYRLPETRTFRHWSGQVPSGFVFAVKASRYLTHLKRLREPGPPLSRLLRRAAALGPKLGPLLFQLPGNFHADAGRLDAFLRALARQRRVPALRAVLEVRHASWLAPEILDRLRAAGVALCLADWRSCPVPGPLTADFVYIRRHGAPRRGGGYTDAMLRADALAVEAWLRAGRDVYVYFNNDGGGWAVRNARRLLELVTARSADAPF